MNEKLLAVVKSYEFIERSTKVILYVKIGDNCYRAKDLYKLWADGRVAEGTGLQNL